MLTLRSSKALSSVDLPTLGLPTMATKPQRKSGADAAPSVGVSGISGSFMVDSIVHPADSGESDSLSPEPERPEFLGSLIRISCAATCSARRRLGPTPVALSPSASTEQLT